jgi:hypothetical protein
VLTCRFNTRKLEDKLRKAAQASPAARRQALIILGHEVVADVLRRAPRDTNRFVNGWAHAGNAAGVGPFPIRPIEKAAKRDEILKKLTAQFDRWDRLVRFRYESKGRDDKWARQARRRRDAAFEQLRRFAEAGDTAIAFDLYDWQSRKTKRALTTIRHKVYGGTGHIVAVGGNRSYLVLHNQEPHTTIVERRVRVMSSAIGKFKGIGFHKATQGYISKVAEASGFATSLKEVGAKRHG